MKHLCPVLLLLLSVPTMAQICQTGSERRSPSETFILHDDGTALQQADGLLWMRCALGQTWRNGQCIGRADNLTWSQAVLLATTHEFAGHKEWRLPTLRELSGILEPACRAPSVNLEVFPGTSSNWYWTATNYAYDSELKWSIYFGLGYQDYTGPYHPSHVRLVRTLDSGGES